MSHAMLAMSRTMIVGTAVVTALLWSGVAMAQDTPAQLAALARDARTAAQHADVAKRFRLQADALDAQAAEHEARAARLSRSAPAIAHKWPSMAPTALKKAKQEAIDTRRAARESRELAETHRALAIEALAAQ
ncbi:MAG: hypothetical protein AB7Q29_05395 [Vicinamibacterales bacterium]